MAETPAPGGSARAIVVGMTDVGRVREHNEDSFLVMNRADGRRTASAERLDVGLDGALLLAVCDGMGGAAAGEVASRMAADRIATDLGKADFSDSSPDQIASMMDHAVQQANADIHGAALANPSQKGMGTTMTAAVVTPGRVFISQVGDSRAYLLRKNLLNQLTKDQSLIGQLIEEGTLTEEEAEKLGGRNIVLQAVGVEENLRVDTKYWPLLRGDVLLVCSDGLSGMVKDAQMKEILQAHAEDPGKAAESLIAEANKNGGRDNVTAIVARFDGEGLRAPMEAAGESELEKAGVAFKAPPPPEVPNPMRRMGWVGLGVVALTAVLFFALRKTTADLRIGVKPKDVAVHVSITGTDGAKYEADSKDGQVSIDDVKPSDKPFDLVATAPHHEDDRKQVFITTAGVVPLEASPVPKPGVVKVVSEKTSRVRAQIVAKGMHEKVNPYEQTKDLGEAGKPAELTNIPAGEVEVKAQRDGFQPLTVKQTLAPEGTIEFRLPALEEIRGSLVVERCEDGAAVKVVDEFGETVGAGTVQGGVARLPVRVGRHTLRVAKDGFKGYESDVTIAEGREAKAEARLELDKPQVRFSGTPGITITVKPRSGEKPFDMIINDGGLSRARLFEPGSYEVSWRDAGGKDRSRSFDVKVGDKPQDIELK